ncbi:unnamed protein product [Phyllotreta striolata]|uniref:Uncharacterized protein n=1 Tax=Phyllotreta striolata TaxID=444603 RepID=A0A9P0DMH4_PHYSR|nr:unnamed protein product [Phyllotreta striolata]
MFTSNFSSTLGAPFNGQPTEPWWKNPCQGLVQLRHARSDKSSLRTQFALLAISLEENVLKNLKILYHNNVDLKVNNSCPRTKAVLRLLNNHHYTVNQANYMFYQAITKLGEFVNTMKNVKIETPAKFDREKRWDIFSDIEINLRNVLCSYELNAGHRRKPSKKIPAKKIEKMLSGKCLPKKMDLTMLQVYDLDVIKKLLNFIKRGKKILRRKRRARVKGKGRGKENGKKRHLHDSKKKHHKTNINGL